MNKEQDYDFENKENIDLLLIKKYRKLENNSEEYTRKVEIPHLDPTITWVVDTLGNVVQIEVPANVELNINKKIVAQADSPLGRALLGIEPVETPIFEDFKNR